MGAEKGKYSKHVMDFMFPYLGLTSHLYGYNGTLIILFAEPQQPGSQTPLSLESADLCNGGPGAIFFNKPVLVIHLALLNTSLFT